MCCFLDLSQTHFSSIKGKAWKKLHGNSKGWEKNLVFKKLFVFWILPDFFIDQCTGGSKKQQINWSGLKQFEEMKNVVKTTILSQLV